jgi:hypothetical protein
MALQLLMLSNTGVGHLAVTWTNHSKLRRAPGNGGYKPL